jgi:hypothetical protein
MEEGFNGLLPDGGGACGHRLKIVTRIRLVQAAHFSVKLTPLARISFKLDTTG